MANSIEIKNRINSVSNTRKITNAMFLISSAKLRKAREDLEKTKPYFYRLEKEIRRIFQNEAETHSPYFRNEDGDDIADSVAYLVITADKGLAGAYNHNVIKMVEAELAEHPNARLFVVGEYGRRYFARHDMPIVQSFDYTAQNPTYRRAREIAGVLLKEYEEGRSSEIRVIYSDMQGDLDCTVKVAKLLPLAKSRYLTPEEERNETDIHFHFNPSVTEALNRIIPGYVSGFLYGALIDSFCAEQNARMNAMSSANKNAEDLLGELYIAYNRVRQAAITQEITEVAAGAKAQRQKKKKKKKKVNSEQNAS